MMPTVLLVDDDDEFMFLVERAFRKSGLQASLQYVSDGEHAIAYLSRANEFSDEAKNPFPALVLLDLKMRRIGGFDVLRWKLLQPGLSKLPFVILSSSGLQEDRDKATRLGAHSYLVKPFGFDGLVELVAALRSFLPDDN